jgi:hypothetical protein
MVRGSATAQRVAHEKIRTLETEGCGTQPPNPFVAKYHNSPLKENLERGPSLTMFARDADPDRIGVYRTST